VARLQEPADSSSRDGSGGFAMERLGIESSSARWQMGRRPQKRDWNDEDEREESVAGLAGVEDGFVCRAVELSVMDSGGQGRTLTQDREARSEKQWRQALPATHKWSVESARAESADSTGPDERGSCVDPVGAGARPDQTGQGATQCSRCSLCPVGSVDVDWGRATGLACPRTDRTVRTTTSSLLC
jgi:hypothetical protein